jgi:hypothetical protein
MIMDVLSRERFI